MKPEEFIAIRYILILLVRQSGIDIRGLSEAEKMLLQKALNTLNI